MTLDLADHVALIAAPIYAAFLARAIVTRADNEIPADVLNVLRRQAIGEALALRLAALELPAS